MCGKKIKVTRSSLKYYKFHFCSYKCHNEGSSLEKNLYNRPGAHINQIGQKLIATQEYYKEPHKGRPKPTRKYRPEHRVIVEEYIGRKLIKNNEPVWHLNGIPDDNRLENLYVFPDRSSIMSMLGGAVLPPAKSNLDLLRHNTQILKKSAKGE